MRPTRFMHRRVSLFFAALSVLVITGTALASERVAVLFVIDGLQTDAALVAMSNGAAHLKFLHDNGVTVEEAYCSSPSPHLRLPDNSLPWGTSSPPNVAMHTGTHVFESRLMDDIFLAARRGGIKSVFSGGADNYKEFSTADYCYASSKDPDSITVQHALDHLRHDGVRLVRLHIQRIRNHWKGPEEKTRPDSPYQQYLLHVDHLLGTVLGALRTANLWDSTYVILSGDHGMGMSPQSNHPASVLSSWRPYMSFYGPGIKRGESIPYAETPDIALMVVHMLGVSSLKGHTDPGVSVTPRGTTGTLLANIFEGNPRELNHPQYIRRYLEAVDWRPSDDFAEYRAAMVKFIATHQGRE